MSSLRNSAICERPANLNASSTRFIAGGIKGNDHEPFAYIPLVATARSPVALHCVGNRSSFSDRQHQVNSLL
jgi:hypothetical protein